MSEYTRALKDSEFEAKVSQSKGLVLVDFWAEWCGPCRTLAPTIEELAKTHDGRVQVYKLDVDSEPNTAGRFHIRGIPTVILFKDGLPVDQIVGSQPKHVFERAIENHLP